MENIRKRTHIKLINDQKKYFRYINKPTFISQKIFDKTFVAVHCVKTVLTLNKPIYLGFSILELSKLFHYHYVSNNFDAKLLFTDTDSLVYKINDDSDNVYKNVLKTNIYLILVDIQKILCIMTFQTKKC